MANFSAGGIRGCPGRMCRIMRLALFLWVLSAFIPGEGALTLSGDLVVYEGDVLSISCNTSGGANETWLVNDAPAADAPGGWEVEGGELMQGNLTVAEHNGSLISCGGVDGYLTVRSVPAITVGPRSAAVNESQDIVLECSVEGGPPLSTRWWRDGRMLVPPDQPRAMLLPNGSLLLANVSRQDAGQYSCQVTWSTASSTSGPANLTVQYLAFLEQPADLEVEQTHPDAAIVLNCTAEGFPLPTVALYKDMGRLNAVLSEVTETAVSYTVTIDSPVVEDSGGYTCIAENAFGMLMSRTAMIRVTVPSVSPPRLTLGDVTANSLLANWTTPSDVATANAIQFSTVMVTEQATGMVVHNSSQLPPNISSYQVVGLQLFTKYRVRVEVRGLANTVSTTLPVTTSEGVPSGPPQNISVYNVTNTSAILKWEEPSTPNGVVTMYRVTTLLQEEEGVFTSSRELVLVDLPPHTQVNVSVAALTSAGPGPVGVAVFHTLEGVPRAAPAGLTVIRKNSTSAELEWEELPTSDLRGNLTTYTVVVCLDGTEHLRLQTNKTKVVVTGLDQFALHHVQVYAETSAGQGPTSSLLLFTDPGVPGNGSSVVNLTATPTGPTSITVWWSPPTDEVYGNITGYLLTWEGAGEGDNSTVNVTDFGGLSEDTLEYNLTGLRPFTTYTIYVRVITVVGHGAEGTPTSARTEESVPSAPQNVAVDIMGAVVQLSWQPPDQANGVLTQYEYQVLEGGGVTKADNVTNATLSATSILKFFKNYTVAVWAWTSRGRGPPAAASFSTDEGPPSAPPTNVSVVTEQRTATVTWSPLPMAYWNGILTGYQVNVSNGYSERVDPTPTELELTGLTPYTNYTVLVAAVTVRVGVFSNGTQFTTEPDEIGDAPQNVTIEMRPNGTSLLVTWDPPTMPNGPLGGYRVSWVPYPFTGTKSERSTGNTSHLLTNLQASTEYRVTVLAYSSSVFGEGPHATVYEFSSEAAPGPVGIIQVLTYANEVQLKWTPPTKPVGRLRGYNVVCPEKPQGDSLNETVTEHTCDGLSPNMSYIIVITAENKFGNGSAAMETVKTACDYQTPQVTGMQFDVPLCGSSPSFKYILVIVRELLGNPSLRPLNNYTLTELLPPSSRTRRQATPTDTSQPYVAANLTWEGLSNFQLGDGGQYGDFTNTPLTAGSSYDTTLFGETFDGVIVAYTPQTFTVPMAVVPNNLIIYIIAGVAALLAVVLLVVICVIICICVSLCRAEKEDDDFGGFSRRSSFRMSFKKPKLVDPLDQFRTTHPWPSLESHPPVPLSGFQSRMTVLQADSNFHFIQEYEGIVIPEEDTYSTEVASSVVNAPKNRYTNIVPYEHSRVKLSPIKGVPGSEYINANYLDGFMRPKAYIAAQGPLKSTAEDFWRLVWEQQSAVVVMLTNLVERSKEKCFMYWPESVEETYGNIDVRLDEVNVLADFTIRTFSLTRVGNQREVRQVKHFQFTAWPDHGVPTYATSMLAFVRRVQAGVQASPDTAGPIVVHCSAGVGRSGTFIVVDSMIRRIKAGIDTLDVFGHVSLLRSQRNFMVQTEDQYFFIYEALSEYVTCGNTELNMEDLMPHMEHLGRIVEGEESTYMELEFKHLALEKNDPNRFTSANQPCNKSKNRYVNILPFEVNRVTLEPIRGVEGSDYINASFIDSYQIQGAFIASQAPLEDTMEHFWRMVWQYKSPIIVMLTQLTEQGVEQCARYWPVDQPVEYGDLLVEPLVGRHTPTYSYREFSLTHHKNDSTHTVRHFHFHCWPEVGVPSTGIPLVELIREVTKMYNQLGSLRPIVVHCSSGVGRTGVFIALNIILERMKLEGVIDVFQTVKMLRIQRPAMVQTLEQYQFCYDTTMEVLSRYDSFKSLLRNTSKARTAHSDVSTFLPMAATSDANFTGTANDGQPTTTSPFPDNLA